MFPYYIQTIITSENSMKNIFVINLNQPCTRNLEHSHRKRKVSLETTVNYIEIPNLSWNFTNGPKHWVSFLKTWSSLLNQLLAGNFYDVLDKTKDINASNYRQMELGKDRQGYQGYHWKKIFTTNSNFYQSISISIAGFSSLRDNWAI